MIGRLKLFEETILDFTIVTRLECWIATAWMYCANSSEAA